MGCCSSGANQGYLSLRSQSDSNNQSVPFVRKMSNIREHYSVVKCLGSGKFGSAYLVKDKKYGMEKVAKELIKSLINDNIIRKLELELSVIKALDHPCILKIEEIIETSTRIYIIQEYLSGGILYGKYSESPKMNERLAAKFMSGIILSLHAIHKLKLIHRDVKPTNLLFESDAPDSHIKLIDFGISILQKKQNFYSDSVHYMAPELINNQATSKSDIWSAGVILYSMLSGSLPFCADSHEDTAKLILSSAPQFSDDCWKNVSAEALSLVQRMLSKNQKDRPTAEQIISDPWIMRYNRNLLKDTPFSQEVQERVIKMNASINLEKAVFSFISNQVLSAKDLKKLKDLFKSLDKDASNTLSINELNSGYDALGLTPPASIVELMKKLDTDDSGSIDYYEFLRGSEEFAKLAMKKELDYNAKKYEKGSDAKLYLLELKGTIPDIQGTEWYSWLTAADMNGDGYITLEELKQYLSVKLGF